MPMRDMAGNYIYVCPRCGLEYTVPADIHYAGGINLHCEAPPCAREILVPTQGDGQYLSIQELVDKYGPKILTGDWPKDDRLHSESNQGCSL